MKKYLMLSSAILGSLFSSCYYDPFVYGNTGASFGVSSFGGNTATSFFVSTGDPRWAYDPYRFAYYDRFRGAFYDPFLYGYYPVGFLPSPIIGCPHPFGWSGMGVCPPPRTIRVRTLSRYDNRISNYQAANYHWSRRVSSAGTNSWISDSERNQLTRQATLAQPASNSSTWRNGSLNRTQTSPNFNAQTPQMRGGLPNAGWTQPTMNNSNRARTQNSSVMPPTFTSESRNIQPRPANGGMFGGLNRSQAQRSQEASRSAAVASAPPARSMPSRPAPTPAPAPAPTPSYRSDSSSNSSSSGDGGYSSPGGLRSGGGSSGGGGLRQFQR